MKRNYYLLNNGRLKRKDNSLAFISENDEMKYIPLEDVEAIYVFGEMDLNSKLIDFLSKNGITLHFFNYYGFYSASIYPREKLVSGMLIVSQTKHYYSKTKRVKLAQNILFAATENILHNLKYYSQRGRDELDTKIERIKELENGLLSAKDIPTIMGFEGNIRKIYYTTFSEIIIKDTDFKERVKRPPDNMINALISFVNTLIYTTVLSEIYKTQLSPVISFLHEPGTKRFSLSLDIAEVFKPLLGDRLIFSLMNKNQITDKHFISDLDYTYLNDDGRKIVLREYDKRLSVTVRHKTLKRNVSYRTLIRLELFKLIKHLVGEQEYIGFKIWW